MARGPGRPKDPISREALIGAARTAFAEHGYLGTSMSRIADASGLRKASASVVAKSFSQVWKARRNDLDDFLNAYPEAAGRLMIGLLSEMSRRLRKMNQKLSNTELQNALQEFFH